jgi:hypothetical protein
MSAAVKLAFERETIILPLAKILPTRELPPAARRNSTYKVIEASVSVIGIVEPLVVFRQPDGTYILLEGHSRLSTVLAAGEKTAECLISTDSERLNFKRQVNHVAPIQANRMIVRALDAGVPEERLAKALNRPLATIRTSRTLLQGICPEALDLLKDKPIQDAALRLFPLVKPLRQIDMAEMMNRMGNYSKTYAQAIVSRTKEELVAEPRKGKGHKKPSPTISPKWRWSYRRSSATSCSSTIRTGATSST